jgi:cholesterol transport system auxiliary component
MRASRCALGAICLLGVTSCALTDKQDAVDARYYSPERLAPPDPPRSPDAKPDSNPAYKLRLRAVRAGAHLKQRLVYRASPTKLGFYEERRWTELPEDYLRRLLSESLFEARKVQRVIAGPAATLEVEMIAFEEMRSPRRVGRVQIMFLVHDGNVVRFQETVTVERPIEGDGKNDDANADATVKALGEALAIAVDRIVARTVSELQSIAPAPPSPVPEPPALP